MPAGLSGDDVTVFRDPFKHVFVVNLWKERRSDPNAEEKWRGSVRVPQNSPVFFETFNRLVEFLTHESGAFAMPWDAKARPGSQSATSGDGAERDSVDPAAPARADRPPSDDDDHDTDES